MKKFISGVVIGAILVSSVTVFASSVSAVANKFKIYVNNKEANVGAYNIDGHTYVKLSDLPELTGLNVNFKDGDSIYIENNMINEIPTDNGANANIAFYADYITVPDYQSVSGIKHKEKSVSQQYNKIKYEYEYSKTERKNIYTHLNMYYEALIDNGFIKVTGIDDDLDFKNNDHDNDIVYKKGNIYVSIDADDDEVTIKMATKG